MDLPAGSSRFEKSSATSFAEEVGDGYLILKHVDDTCGYIANNYVYLFGVKLEDINLENIFHRGDGFVCLKDKDRGVLRAYYQPPKHHQAKDTFDRIERLVNFCERRKVTGLIRDELFDRLLERLDGDDGEGEVERDPGSPEPEEETDGDVLESVLSVFEDNSLDNFWEDICGEAENTDDLISSQAQPDAKDHLLSSHEESRICERRSDDELSDCLSVRDALSYAGSDDEPDLASVEPERDDKGEDDAKKSEDKTADDLNSVVGKPEAISKLTIDETSPPHEPEEPIDNKNNITPLNEIPPTNPDLPSGVSEGARIEETHSDSENHDRLIIEEEPELQEPQICVKREVLDRNESLAECDIKAKPCLAEIVNKPENPDPILDSKSHPGRSSGFGGSNTFRSSVSAVKATRTPVSCKICDCSVATCESIDDNIDGDDINPEMFKYSSVIIQRCHAPLLKDFEGKYYIEFKNLDRVNVPLSIVHKSVTSSWKTSSYNIVCVDVCHYREMTSGKLGYFARTATLPGSPNVDNPTIKDAFVTVFASRTEGIVLEDSQESVTIKLSVSDVDHSVTFMKCTNPVDCSNLVFNVGMKVHCDILRIICGKKFREILIHSVWTGDSTPGSNRMFSCFCETVHEQVYSSVLSSLNIPRGQSAPAVEISEEKSVSNAPRIQVDVNGNESEGVENHEKGLEVCKDPLLAHRNIRDSSKLVCTSDWGERSCLSCDCSNSETILLPAATTKTPPKSHWLYKYRAVAVLRCHTRLLRDSKGFFIMMKNIRINIPHLEISREIRELWNEDIEFVICIDICQNVVDRQARYLAKRVCLPDTSKSDPRIVEDTYFTIHIAVVEGWIVSCDKVRKIYTVALKANGSVYVMELEVKRYKLDVEDLRKGPIHAITMQYYVSGELIRILVPSMWMEGKESPTKFHDFGSILTDDYLLTDRVFEVSQLLSEILKYGFDSVKESLRKLDESAYPPGLIRDNLSKPNAAETVKCVKCDCIYKSKPAMVADSSPPKFVSVCIRKCHTKLLKDEDGFHVFFMKKRIDIPDEKVAKLERCGERTGRLVCLDIGQYMLPDEKKFVSFVQDICNINTEKSESKNISGTYLTIRFLDVEGEIKKDGLLSSYLVEMSVNGLTVIEKFETSGFFPIGLKVNCSIAQFYVDGALCSTLLVQVGLLETCITVNHLSVARQRHYTRMFLRKAKSEGITVPDFWQDGSITSPKGYGISRPIVNRIKSEPPAEDENHSSSVAGLGEKPTDLTISAEGQSCTSCICSPMPRHIAPSGVKDDHVFKYPSLIIQRYHTTLFRDHCYYVKFAGRRISVPLRELDIPRAARTNSWKEMDVCLDVGQYILLGSPVLFAKNIRPIGNKPLESLEQNSCEDASLCIFVDEIEALVLEHNGEHHIKVEFSHGLYCLPLGSSLFGSTDAVSTIVGKTVNCIILHFYHKGNFCDAWVRFSWVGSDAPPVRRTFDCFSVGFQRMIETRALSEFRESSFEELQKRVIGCKRDLQNRSCRIVEPLVKVRPNDLTKISLEPLWSQNFYKIPFSSGANSSGTTIKDGSLAQGKGELERKRSTPYDPHRSANCSQPDLKFFKSGKNEIPNGNLLPDLVASCTPSLLPRQPTLVSPMTVCNSVPIKREFQEPYFFRGVQRLPLRSLLAAKIPGRFTLVGTNILTVDIPGFMKMQLLKEDTQGPAQRLFQMNQKIDGPFYFCQYINESGNPEYLICEKPELLKSGVTVIMIKARGIISAISGGNCIVEQNRPTSACGISPVNLPNQISVPEDSVSEPEVGEIIYYDCLFYLDDLVVVDYTVLKTDQEFRFVPKFFNKQFQTSVEEKYKSKIDSKISRNMLETEGADEFITARLVECLNHIGTDDEVVKLEAHGTLEDGPPNKKAKFEHEGTTGNSKVNRKWSPKKCSEPKSSMPLASSLSANNESHTPVEPSSSKNMQWPISVCEKPFRNRTWRKDTPILPARHVWQHTPPLRHTVDRPRVLTPIPPQPAVPGVQAVATFGAAVLGKLIGEQILAQTKLCGSMYQQPRPDHSLTSHYQASTSQSPQHKPSTSQSQPHLPAPCLDQPMRHAAPRGAFGFFPWPRR